MSGCHQVGLWSGASIYPVAVERSDANRVEQDQANPAVVNSMVHSIFNGRCIADAIAPVAVANVNVFVCLKVRGHVNFGAVVRVCKRVVLGVQNIIADTAGMEHVNHSIRAH